MFKIIWKNWIAARANGTWKEFFFKICWKPRNASNGLGFYQVDIGETVDRKDFDGSFLIKRR